MNLGHAPRKRTKGSPADYLSHPDPEDQARTSEDEDMEVLEEVDKVRTAALYFTSMALSQAQRAGSLPKVVQEHAPYLIQEMNRRQRERELTPVEKALRRLAEKAVSGEDGGRLEIKDDNEVSLYLLEQLDLIETTLVGQGVLPAAATN